LHIASIEGMLQTSSPLAVVPYVDLTRYTGTWYAKFLVYFSVEKILPLIGGGESHIRLS
jgi:hypothetical protein